MTAPITTTAARRTIEGFSITHAALIDKNAPANLREIDMYAVRTASLAPDLGNVDNTGDDGVLSTWNWFNFATFNLVQGYLSLDQYARMSGTEVTEEEIDPTVAVLTINPLDGFDYTGTPATFSIDGTDITLDQAYATPAAMATAIDAELGAGFTVAPTDEGRVAIARTSGRTYITVGGPDAADIDYVSLLGDPGGTELSVPFWQEDCGNQPPWPVLVRAASRDALGNSLALDILLYKVQFGPVNIGNQEYKSLWTFNTSGRVLLSPFDHLGNPLPGNKKACGKLISRTVL